MAQAPATGPDSQAATPGEDVLDALPAISTEESLPSEGGQGTETDPAAEVTEVVGEGSGGVDPPDPSEADAAPDEEGLRFTFEGTPWREVIRWVADESGMALHMGDLPTGSFTYTDPSTFTPREAIDRINLFLLPHGFTLIQSGNLLSVVNLGDPRSVQYLDALAELVTIEQLDSLGNHDVVKCFFPLGEFEPEEALEELSELNLMVTPAVFSKTNRLLITDTVARLKSVKSIIESFQPTTMEDGTVMKNFTLEYVDAEDILAVARPHLGLATGEMIGIDVSLSADPRGKNIFVTGVEDKVALIEGLVTSLDVPQEDLARDGKAELRSHVVEGGNVEMVYNVLLTLLSGQSVRLSMDETAGTIIALATPEIQQQIADTITQLQATDAEFAVIQLKWVDPYFAISLLEQMLDLADLKRRSAAGMEALERHGNARILDMDTDVDVPKLDADPGNMRLYVRAKKPVMEQIKKMVAEFDVSTTMGMVEGAEDREGVRLFPIPRSQAEATLETAAKFWRAENPIILFPAVPDDFEQNRERVVVEEQTGATAVPGGNDEDMASTPKYLTDNLASQAAPIRCQMTARGLWIQSDDTDALDRFFEHLQTIAGPIESLPSPPIVFYLKYTRAEDAIRMLAELLDGGEAAKDAEAGTLVNGYVSSGSSELYLGSIVTSRDGTMTMMADSITVVADSRLNRLIAQGTAHDIEKIEGYLKIIDKDTSLTDVEIYGTSHVIELYNTKASEVAAAIRDAYAGRVAAGSTAGQPASGGTAEQAQRQAMAAMAAMAAARGGDGKSSSSKKSNGDNRSSGGRSQNVEPRMTLAVHEPSNSLIVTAPEPLFIEVERLAREIDARNEQAVELIVPIHTGAVREMLEQGLLGGATTGSPRSGSPQHSPAPRPTPGAPWNRGGR